MSTIKIHEYRVRRLIECSTVAESDHATTNLLRSNFFTSAGRYSLCSVGNQPRATARQAFAPVHSQGSVRILCARITLMRVKPLMRQIAMSVSAARSAGQFLNAHEMNTLAAACARLIPQPDREPFLGIARAIDFRLTAENAGHWTGTAYFLDARTFRLGLHALDRISQARLRRNFAELDALRQDQILASVQRGIANNESWTGITPQRFLEELLHEATELYHTAPVTEEAV